MDGEPERETEWDVVDVQQKLSFYKKVDARDYITMTQIDSFMISR